VHAGAARHEPVRKRAAAHVQHAGREVVLLAPLGDPRVERGDTVAERSERLAAGKLRIVAGQREQRRDCGLVRFLRGGERGDVLASGRGLHRADGLSDPLDRLVLLVQQPRAQLDDPRHQFLALGELRLERGPGLLAIVVQPDEPASGGDDCGGNERRDGERDDPEHDRFEYIIGLHGFSAGRR
jgi:hypothetical protein